MTLTRYYVALFAKAFGFMRRNQRIAEVSSEMHLLREAEAQLGAGIWEKVEKIEDLSVEYWNLRKFIKEREIIRQKLAVCQERLDKAHEERANVINTAPEIHQELAEKRTALLSELEQHAQSRDEVVASARNIRRAYDGMKMKLEVLGKDGHNKDANQAEIERIRERLGELKATFAELRDKRTLIAAKIDEADMKVNEVEALLQEKKKTRRVTASESFQIIGEGNRKISKLRAESGVLDTQMRQLYAEIGRYVSRNASHDAACAAAAASHQGLVDVMRALRRSIALNHRLAGTT